MIEPAARVVVSALDGGLAVYFLAVQALYTALFVAAIAELRADPRDARGEDLEWLTRTPGMPSVVVIVPAFNEEEGITGTVEALLALPHPDLSVVAVSDGSTDETVPRLVERFGLEAVPVELSGDVVHAPIRAVMCSSDEPRLTVVDKDNGGKADAVNAGLRAARAELVCVLDADTIILPGALLRLSLAFARDPELVAAGGTLRVAPRGMSTQDRGGTRPAALRPVLAFQQVEYVRAFLFGRLGWNRLGGNLIISGAFGMFPRRGLLEAGGYTAGSTAEDFDMVVRLLRQARSEDRAPTARLVPGPTAVTEAPTTLRALAAQRARWHRGLAEVLSQHRDVIGRRRHGVLGVWLLPAYTVAELLGPVVELVGLGTIAAALLLDAVHMPLAGAALLVAWVWNALLSLGSLALDERAPSRPMRATDRAMLVGWALLEPFTYRPATVVWRLRGLMSFVGGRRGWRGVTRSRTA